MDIERRKEEVKLELAELKNEAKQLMSNIDIMLEHLDEVQTEADIEEFDRKYNIEHGLKHIEIF